ncbi:MAG: response regulator transcription factor [Leadbetterella sp.]|nr:response regulator transcription factor [Leadbetterella sp.]
MIKKYKVLIVDDHKILLDSLSLLINSIEDMEVTGTVSDSRRVPDFLTAHEVDILVTDMNMPYSDGIDLTLKVRSLYPDLKILMLTVNDTAETIREAFQAGISGYITKKASKEELNTAFRTILRGEKFFSNDVMKELLNPSVTVYEEVSVNDLKALSARELEVVRLIAQEYSSSEIAEQLFISPGTVENHRHNILQKLGVKNSIGIIKYALKYGLV